MPDAIRVGSRAVAKSPASSEILTANGFVYLSGQTTVAPDNLPTIWNPDAQLQRIYSNLDHTMSAVGGTAHDLLRITTYVTHPDHYSAVARARARYLGSRPPVSSTFVVSMLVDRDAAVAVEAIGLVGDRARERRCLNLDDLPPPEAHSHVVQVGPTIHVSGQVAYSRDGGLIGPGDPSAQAIQTFRNIRKCLEAVGARAGDVVHTRAFSAHPAHLEPIRAAALEFHGSALPAHTAVCVASLAKLGPLIQIEATAVVGAPIERIPGVRTPATSSRVVVADSLAYVSAQGPIDESGRLAGHAIESQFRQVAENVQDALRSIAVSGYKVLRTTTYIRHPAFAADVQRIRRSFAAELPPDTTLVTGLPVPEWLVQMEAVAAI